MVEIFVASPATEAMLADRSYNPNLNDLTEKAETVIFGEDLDESARCTGDIPIRILTDFVVFDPSVRLEYITLDSIETGRCSQAEAAGFVAPEFVNEEDAGQEDELDDELDLSLSLQHFRTSAVFRYYIDYEKMDE